MNKKVPIRFLHQRIFSSQSHQFRNLSFSSHQTHLPIITASHSFVNPFQSIYNIAHYSKPSAKVGGEDEEPIINQEENKPEETVIDDVEFVEKDSQSSASTTDKTKNEKIQVDEEDVEYAFEDTDEVAEEQDTEEDYIEEPQSEKEILSQKIATKFRRPKNPERFAIVQVGGHQYKVIDGDIIITDKLEVEVGASIYLNKVLLVAGKDWSAIGRPLVENARIRAVVEQQTRTEKQIIFKKRRRKNSRRWKAHQQPITVLRIEDVEYDVPEVEESKERVVTL